MQMKIVVLDGYTLCPEDSGAKAFGELGCALQVYDRTAPSQTAARIGDAQIVLTNKTLVTREVMEACPALRYVGVLATGYNVVDVAAADERGIVLTNVPAYSTQAVAQHTMALLLESASRVGAYDAQVKAGAWSASPDFCFFAGETEELAGKTLGIVGFGHIGQAVARAAMGLGMQVIANARSEKPGWPQVRFVPRETLFAQSDIISLHCPLTEETRGMIGAQAIAAMRSGVRVINTARGPLVDEAAMADALRTGRVACYMADVLDTEPPAADSPLLAAPNTILTPHVAWAARQTRERLARIAVSNVRAFLQGAPANAVGRAGRGKEN